MKINIKGFVRCWWRKAFPHPWDKYMVLFTPDNKQVWCRRRKGNCPLHIATVCHPAPNAEADVPEKAQEETVLYDPPVCGECAHWTGMLVWDAMTCRVTGTYPHHVDSPCDCAAFRQGKLYEE